MRLITLSDHAADQQRKAQAGRAAQDLSAQEEYERKVAKRAERIAGSRAALSLVDVGTQAPCFCRSWTG